jgi:hypothetical protein
MKTLKRTMAGEYSRELSIKIRAGLVRLTKNGFKPGGQPVYGMRRMLLDTRVNPNGCCVMASVNALLVNE